MLIFDSYSNHVEKEGMRPAFSDSEVTPQDVPPGTAGFPVVAEKGQAARREQFVGAEKDGAGCGRTRGCVLTFPVWLTESWP